MTLIIPCSSYYRWSAFSSRMCTLEKEACDFRRRNLANSPYFSLLTGNLAGERLARDCALRQPLISGAWHHTPTRSAMQNDGIQQGRCTSPRVRPASHSASITWESQTILNSCSVAFLWLSFSSNAHCAELV